MSRFWNVAWVRGFGLASGLLLIVAGGEAKAQFGYGGYGLYNRQDGQQTINYLNQKSLISAQAAYASRPQNLQAAPFQSRDGSLDRYNIQTRLAIEETTDKLYGGPPVGSRPAAPAPPAPTRSRIGNYYDSYEQLVWLAEAPTDGDLGTKRQVSDAASRTVLVEFRKNGHATPEHVAEARQKLLDYGRPALQRVRQTTTPAVADSFHAFLMGIYNDLAAAANVPAPTR